MSEFFQLTAVQFASLIYLGWSLRGWVYYLELGRAKRDTNARKYMNAPHETGVMLLVHPHWRHEPPRFASVYSDCAAPAKVILVGADWTPRP
jgi:hypothetical protein